MSQGEPTDPGGSPPSLWLSSIPLILASGSRTRADLLASAGLMVEVVKPDVDERRLEAEAGGLEPVQLACYLARSKARVVAVSNVDRVIIGADQVLELDGRLLHKPADLADARVQLERLQSRTHVLHSAVAIAHHGGVESFYDTARLTMRPLDASAIAAYLTFAGFSRVTSSVGGYQLEGPGIHLFDKVEGDHSTVLGLPLLPLLARLRAMSLLAIG